MDATTLLTNTASSQNDDMPDKAFKPFMELVDMLLAFRQQEGGPAFFHSHEDIIDDLLVAFIIGDQQAIECLDGHVGRLHRGNKAGFSDNESVIERALGSWLRELDLNKTGPICILVMGW